MGDVKLEEVAREVGLADNRGKKKPSGLSRSLSP